MPTLRMPALCALLPMAASYADDVTFRYCDGREQRHRIIAQGKAHLRAKHRPGTDAGAVHPLVTLLPDAPHQREILLLIMIRGGQDAILPDSGLPCIGPDGRPGPACVGRDPRARLHLSLTLA